jgi:protein-tyrosine phosphatase
MPSDLYWIETGSPLRLAIMARPRAGDWLEDEIDHWRREGVGVVVSLLEAHEVVELGLQEEERLCAASGVEFIANPIPDRGVPDPKEAVRLARRVMTLAKPTAIHCRAGIGRSSVIAATILRLGGMEGEAAFDAIERARGLAVPDTEAQRDWLLALPLRD